MRCSILASGARKLSLGLIAATLASPLWAQHPSVVSKPASHAKISVPTEPPAGAEPVNVRDKRYGVRFQIPPGWSFTRNDYEVSTFRLDARSATPQTEVRGVASIGFNPFPKSVLSGALFYFSVQRHSSDAACASEATVQPAAPTPVAERGGFDTERIGGMSFVHGHDEHGAMCVEGRDEVYTAFRKGSCYRFDLAVNTFCAESSGADELSYAQMHELESRMVGILSTVTLDWEKSGPEPVPVPDIAPALPAEKPNPRRTLPFTPPKAATASSVGQ